MLATINLVVSVRLFDPHGSGRLPPTNFFEHAYVNFFTKICPVIEIFVKIGQK